MSEGRRHVHAVTEGDPTQFVRELLTHDSGASELEVKRASLEDTYMSLVHRAESDPARRAERTGPTQTDQTEQTEQTEEAQS